MLFLWNGATNSARGAKVSWISICTPKKAGGLGLRRLADSNQIFGLKLIWLLYAGSDSLWVAWVHKKHHSKSSFLDCGFLCHKFLDLEAPNGSS